MADRAAERTARRAQRREAREREAREREARDSARVFQVAAEVTNACSLPSATYEYGPEPNFFNHKMLKVYPSTPWTNDQFAQFTTRMTEALVGDDANLVAL